MFSRFGFKRLLCFYYSKPLLQRNTHFHSQFQLFSLIPFSAAAHLSPYLSDSASDDITQNTVPFINSSNSVELDTCKVIEILNSLRQDPNLALSFFGQLKEQGFNHNVAIYVEIIRIVCNWGMPRKLDSIFLEVIKSQGNIGFGISDVLEKIIEELVEKGPSSLTRALDGLVKAYVRVFMFDEAIDTLFKTKRRGFLPDIKTINFLMNRLVKSRKEDTSLAIYRQLKMLGLSPNVYTCSIAIKALCRRGEFGEVDVIFEEMDETGIEPDEYMYATYIEGLCSYGMANAGYEMLRILREQNIKINLYAYTAVIRAFVTEMKLDKAERVFADMDEQGLVPDARCYGELIRGYCMIKNIHKVLVIDTEMLSKGVETNCVIVSLILKCLREMGLACEVVEQFNHYKGLGVFLDEVSYNDVVGALCQLGRLEEAVEFLDEMKGKQMVMDIVHYTTLMDGYFCHERVNDALSLFEEMEKNGIKPETVAYNVVAKGLARNRLVQEALRLLDHMERKGIRPTSVTHNMIIEGLCVGGKVKEAEVFFQNLKDKCLDNYAAMVSGYCEADGICYTRAAYELFDMLSKQDIILKRSVCVKLFKNLCARGENPRVRELFDTLFNYGALCNILYNNFIGFFCSCGDMKNARWVFDTMIKTGLAPDVITYTIMMKGYSRANCLQEAYDLFEEMKKRGVKPDIITYTVLLDGHSKIKREKGCSPFTGVARNDISILQSEMREMDAQPDVICYTVLIDRYCKSDSLEDALLLFDEMIDRGLEPDSKTYKALVCGYCSHGNMNGAITLVKKMPFKDDVVMSALHHYILKAKKLQMWQK